MQAMQGHKNFNIGLGWVGEICAVDAERCEAHQNLNLNEKLVHLHCLIREAPVHAGSKLQPKKTKECQIAPSVGSREVLQASSHSAAYCVAALGDTKVPMITVVHCKR